MSIDYVESVFPSAKETDSAFVLSKTYPVRVLEQAFRLAKAKADDEFRNTIQNLIDYAVHHQLKELEIEAQKELSK